MLKDVSYESTLNAEMLLGKFGPQKCERAATGLE